MDAQLVLDQCPDAVVVAGLDGIVTYWNAAATRIFGHEASAAVGQSLDLIIPEQYRDAHWTGYDRALGDGDTKFRGQSLPTKSMKADGTAIYVELSFAITKDSEGVVSGAMAVARDITERFESDRAMRRELRELKAKGAGPA